MKKLKHAHASLSATRLHGINNINTKDIFCGIHHLINTNRSKLCDNHTQQYAVNTCMQLLKKNTIYQMEDERRKCLQEMSYNAL